MSEDTLSSITVRLSIGLINQQVTVPSGATMAKCTTVAHIPAWKKKRRLHARFYIPYSGNEVTITEGLAKLQIAVSGGGILTISCNEFQTSADYIEVRVSFYS